MPGLLFIQIPALNETDTIAGVLDEVPRMVAGFRQVKILIINDGSIDGTLKTVKQWGVKHVLDFKQNHGLGHAFRSGLAYALKQGADVIVNLDADHQYQPGQIGLLAAPIVSGLADAVIGDRKLSKVSRYPAYMRMAQSSGNALMSLLFQFPVRDATSGFRAFNRKAAELLVSQLENDYTYTVESLGLLLKNKMRVAYVPIDIRYPTRPTRLIKSRGQYVRQFIGTAFKIKFRKP